MKRRERKEGKVGETKGMEWTERSHKARNRELQGNATDPAM